MSGYFFSFVDCQTFEIIGLNPVHGLTRIHKCVVWSGHMQFGPDKASYLGNGDTLW